MSARSIRRTAIVVATAIVSLMVSALPAAADHTAAATRVDVYRGTTRTASYFRVTGCTTTLCEVSLNLNNRDFGRFVKWCGSDRLTLTVTSGTSVEQSVPCLGPSAWSISVEAWLTDPGNNTLQTHSGDVSINVIAT